MFYQVPGSARLQANTKNIIYDGLSSSGTRKRYILFEYLRHSLLTFSHSWWTHGLGGSKWISETHIQLNMRKPITWRSINKKQAWWDLVWTWVPYFGWSTFWCIFAKTCTKLWYLLHNAFRLQNLCTQCTKYKEDVKR